MSDSYLKCTVCGRESTTNFASSLATGWERCCGYTMRLVRTEADIAAAVGAVVSSPEALDLRHAGNARLLNQDEDPSTPDGAYAIDEPVEEE